MSQARHCRHCAGDCPGDCLIGQTGMCIHGWNEKPPRQFSWQVLLTRRWWHRVFWGDYSSRRRLVFGPASVTRVRIGTG